jgi:hypothetical protein
LPTKPPACGATVIKTQFVVIGREGIGRQGFGTSGRMPSGKDTYQDITETNYNEHLHHQQ